jgi:hypothetical protein
MFAHEMTVLENGRIHHYRLLKNSAILPYNEVIQLWQTDEDFVTFFIQLLADCSFAAFRWETPAITTTTQAQDFQFVLLRDEWLGRRQPNPHSFANQLAHCDEADPVATFGNLGGDAIMVVPAGLADDTAYTEIASFSRHAPLAQQKRLWQAVGLAMSNRVGKDPVWLSCAGGGVAWLHVRLDSRPKYYGYTPYR